MSLDAVLDAAQHILDTRDSDPHARLARFYAVLGEQSPATDIDTHLETARAALHVVRRVQLLLDDPDIPAIGTRDLNVLRTLLTLLFQRGINPLLTRLDPLWRKNSALSAPLADLAALYALLSDLMSTLFPHGVHAQPPQTLITTTILHRHVPDLLKASIALAWLPKSLWPQGDFSLHALRPSVLRLLELCVYMRCISAHLILNRVVKPSSVPGHDRSRRSIVEHASSTPACP